MYQTMAKIKEKHTPGAPWNFRIVDVPSIEIPAKQEGAKFVLIAGPGLLVQVGRLDGLWVVLGCSWPAFT